MTVVGGKVVVSVVKYDRYPPPTLPPKGCEVVRSCLRILRLSGVKVVVRLSFGPLRRGAFGVHVSVLVGGLPSGLRRTRVSSVTSRTHEKYTLHYPSSFSSLCPWTTVPPSDAPVPRDSRSGHPRTHRPCEWPTISATSSSTRPSVSTRGSSARPTRRASRDCATPTGGPCTAASAGRSPWPSRRTPSTPTKGCPVGRGHRGFCPHPLSRPGPSFLRGSPETRVGPECQGPSRRASVGGHSHPRLSTVLERRTVGWKSQWG